MIIDLVVLFLLGTKIFNGFSRGFTETIKGYLLPLLAFYLAFLTLKMGYGTPYIEKYLEAYNLNIDGLNMDALQGLPLFSLFPKIQDYLKLGDLSFLSDINVVLFLSEMFIYFIVILIILKVLTGGILGALTRIKIISFLDSLIGGVSGLAVGVLFSVLFLGFCVFLGLLGVIDTSFYLESESYKILKVVTESELSNDWFN